MTHRTIALAALERWRDALRRMDISPPHGPEWQQAYIDEESAKGEYQQAFDDARRLHLPQPPPFEEAIERD